MLPEENVGSGKGMKPGELFTRTEIMHICGGENQTYLPQKDKVIVAGCFILVGHNPGAPREVLVGVKPKNQDKAWLLTTQPWNVFPAFTKESERDEYYTFRGYYKFDRYSVDPEVLEEAGRRSGRLGELTIVLYLQPAK